MTIKEFKAMLDKYPENTPVACPDIDGNVDHYCEPELTVIHADYDERYKCWAIVRHVRTSSTSVLVID